MPSYDYTPDRDRRRRLGMDESIFCHGKTVAQIGGIIEEALALGEPLLLTRLEPDKHAALAPGLHARLDYDPASRSAILGTPPVPAGPPRVAVVSAGTSDVGVAREAVRTLAFNGHAAHEVHDVGVAGLWRLLERAEELAAYPVLIVVAGMDAALASVAGGMLPGAIVAVPTSTGYGVATGGHGALGSMLASCAPGVTVVNIDNGYGAACAAIRILRAIDGTRQG